jgi:predicted metal-dependent hydrolase
LNSALQSGKFAAGRDLWKQGDPFQAHELWEELWRETRDEERMLLQGLIQIAAGWVKLRQGNGRGTRSLLSKGIAKAVNDGRFAGWKAQVDKLIALVASGDLPEAQRHGEEVLKALPFP